jgi:ABC-2 type transport system ATP-binding protein
LEAIVTQGLTKYYNHLLALEDLNLKINSGDCVGFLGPNGAGKSTTIKILCNLIRPTKGKAYINGKDITSEPKLTLREIGAFVEVPEFYVYFNPIEALSYLGELRGIEKSVLKRRIKEVLELVRLSEWSKMKIGKFSRGMKQRLGIAQVILHDPPILILDEPTLGLDPRGMHEIREIIKDLRKQGKTVFFASHLLHEVGQICDRVALINKGKLLAYDYVENLEKIFKVQKIEIEALHPIEAKQMEQIREMKSVKSISTEGKRILIDFEGNEIMRADLLAVLIRDLNLRIISFKPSMEALEEIYLQLIKEAS